MTFHRAAERSCGYVIDACGDKHLDAYTKADANAFRDALIARGLNGSSITQGLRHGSCGDEFRRVNPGAKWVSEPV